MPTSSCPEFSEEATQSRNASEMEDTLLCSDCMSRNRSALVLTKALSLKRTNTSHFETKTFAASIRSLKYKCGGIMMKLLISISIVFFLNSHILFASTGDRAFEVRDSAELQILEAYRAGQLPLPNNGMGNGLQIGMSCLTGMFQTVSDGRNAKLEQQQSAADQLLSMSEKFTDLGRQCRNDLGAELMKLEQAQLEFNNQQSLYPIELSDLELDYDDAVANIENQCLTTSNQQFAEFKANESNPNRVLTTEDGGAKAYFGRAKRINTFRDLFNRDCLSQQAGALERAYKRWKNAERRMAIEQKNASEQLASVTRQIEFAQSQTIRNCAESKDQLEAQEAIIRNVQAQAADNVQRDNRNGVMNQGLSCLTGFVNAMGGSSSPDATNKNPNSNL